ncbi:MAG: DUF45 domain-containing protein, partial [Pirellulaceae bacterium]|nr:DUF45 domain-containing protein [Pirellulaceae bacterium]
DGGYCDSKKRVIQLAGELADDPALLRKALIHEMCHHGCPSHGKKFLAKLDRLAAMGEEWAADEAKMYRDSPSWNEEMQRVRQSLEEIADDCVRSSRKTAFGHIRSQFAQEFGFSQHELGKKVPWLRASWKNALERAQKADKVRSEIQQKAKTVPEHLLDEYGKIRPTRRALALVSRQNSDLPDAEKYRLAQAQTMIDWFSGVEQ